MQKKYYYIIGFILFICYYPLLFPGYIFSLDQAIPYVYSSLPSFGANNYWVHIIGLGFSTVWIPTWILEKLVYVLMFSTISIYGYKLLKNTGSQLAIVFGILFLFLNPFFYARFVEWQVNIYLSYALFIPLLYYVYQYFQEQKYTLWKVIAPLSLLLCLTSIHNVFFIALTLSVFAIVYLIYEVDKKTLTKSLAILAISIIILNSLWIIPTIQRDDLTSQISSFQENHQNAFQSPKWGYGVYVSVASLRGYRGEGEKRFIQAELENTYYIFLVVILYFLTWAGAYTLAKQKNTRSLAITLIILWFVCYILALGISQNNLFAWLNSFLLNSLPYYSGFREPQKRILVYTTVFTVFTSYGIKTLTEFLSTGKRQIFLSGCSILIILLPIIYTPATLVWHWWQLRPKLYPPQWQEIQDITYDTLPLESCSREKCYSSLVFPWHGYIGIRWTETPITLSGIAKYFSPNALIGDTLEIRDIYTQSVRPESKIIEKYIAPTWLLRTENTPEIQTQFIQDVTDLGIQYIILLKEADYVWYEEVLSELETQGNITVEKQNDMAILYKIQ